MRDSLYIPGIPKSEQGNVVRLAKLVEEMGFTVKLANYHRTYYVQNKHQQTEISYSTSEILHASENLFDRLKGVLVYCQTHPRMPRERKLTEEEWIEKYGSLLGGPPPLSSTLPEFAERGNGNSIDPNTIKTKQSNSVPLPQGYRTDLPDQAPENHEAYRDFHNQIGRLMAEKNLSQIEKLVMIAYLLHGTDASDDKIMQVCGLSRHGLYACQVELMRSDGYGPCLLPQNT